MLQRLSARSQHVNQTASITTLCKNKPRNLPQTETINDRKEVHCHDGSTSSVNSLTLSGGEDSDSGNRLEDCVLRNIPRSTACDDTGQTPNQTTPTLSTVAEANTDEGNHRLKTDQIELPSNSQKTNITPLFYQSPATSLNAGRGKTLMKILQHRTRSTPPVVESTSDQPVHFYSDPSQSPPSVFTTIENEPHDFNKLTDQQNIVIPNRLTHSSPESDSQSSPSTINSVNNTSLSTTDSKQSAKNEGSPEVSGLDRIEHAHQIKSPVVSSSSTPQKPRRVKLAAVFPQSPPSPDKTSACKFNIELLQPPPLLTPVKVCSSLREHKEFEPSEQIQLPSPVTPVKVHQPPPEASPSLKSDDETRRDPRSISLDSKHSHPSVNLSVFPPVDKDQSSDDEDQSESKDVFGRDRGEIEQTIASLQRNTRRWQVHCYIENVLGIS